jgi:hypothetical protein
MSGEKRRDYDVGYGKPPATPGSTRVNPAIPAAARADRKT